MPTKARKEKESRESLRDLEAKRQHRALDRLEMKPGMTHREAHKLLKEFQRDLCYGEVVTSWAGKVS
jgi:hypothetical protein